jgi:signal transduction histidine kinase
MSSIVPPGKSLKYYALLSWIVPGFIAILCCVFIFLGSATLSYRSEIRRIEDELISKSITVSRRLSAELLLGNRGAPTSVATLLQRELSLGSIEIRTGAECVADADFCTASRQGALRVFRKIPLLSVTTYAVLESKTPKYSTFLNLSSLLWATLPIGLMFAIGLAFQRFILKRYFLNPVQTLFETSTGNKEAKEFWPIEIRQISNQLYESFEVREKEVFAQIARGVIHDLRTLIHAPLASVELVDEASDNLERRSRRLESLKTICAQQLPKMREIIDHTLDGSRDISVNARTGTLEKSLNGVAGTLSGLLKQSKTTLEVLDSVQALAFAHDQIQVERALTNLVKNGIEACQDSTRSERLVAIATSKTEGSITIEIEDSGPGLKAAPGRLFRPLKSTKTHGSGLGLTVSRKIIEAHGGTLATGKSERLGGAKFIISIPIVESTEGTT